VTTTVQAQTPPPQVTATTETDVEQSPPMTDDGTNYEVVKPPIGATVPYLPEDANEQTIKGKKYFVHDGTYYMPFSGGGETIYMVVKKPQ
jgi:hypothetical protein